MLKKSAGGVRRVAQRLNVKVHTSDIRNTEGAYPFAKTHCKGERVHEVWSVPPRPSLAAALPDSLFEHPADDPALSIYLLPVDFAAQKLSFSANCQTTTSETTVAIDTQCSMIERVLPIERYYTPCRTEQVKR